MSGDDLVVVRGGRREAGDDDDLVRRALRVCSRTASIELRKRIPAGAGLGGGSADAAAILRWAGVDDPVTASSIGADVAFCLRGGRARVRGIGEIVEPLEHREQVVTLMTPPIHCSTPLVYRRWDELGGPTGDFGNDLEPAALGRLSDARPLARRTGRSGGRPTRLAGSGSTWFVDGAFEGPGCVVTEAVPAG